MRQRDLTGFHARHRRSAAPPRRSGLTLIEVLVAIFVMAIGLMALLTLFPLGALRMGQAIQDDRAAHVCRNAEALATFRNLRHDTWLAGSATAADVFNDGNGFVNTP